MSLAIVLEHLTCRFGDTVAVDDLSLAVRTGEVFGLLGHNGAGKTTTIRAATGIVEPAAGTVRVLGYSPDREGAALRARTAVLTEQPSLDERLSARETLASFADLYGVPRAVARTRIDELLARFGLAARIDDRVGSFSKGMRQRLALCRALVHDPELLILDEPTAGLDPVATRQLHELVQQWSRDHLRTIVLCTHNLDEAQRLCERVAVMARGRLLGLGTPAELAARVGAALELRVSVSAEDLATAIAIVRTQPTLVLHAVERDAIVVRHAAGGGDGVVPELATALVHAGVRLHALVPTPPSLSDVYFALQPEHAPPTADVPDSAELLVETAR